MAGAPKGNQNATKGKRLSSLLRKRLEERAEEEELMNVLLDKALDGDLQSIKEVFDRLEGKPKQSVDVEANIVAREAKELSDDELANIASGSS